MYSLYIIHIWCLNSGFFFKSKVKNLRRFQIAVMHLEKMSINGKMKLQTSFSFLHFCL